MVNKKEVPTKIELSATDPFLKYLAHMYNSGIDYMTQSEDILKNMDDYKKKLNEFMENNKLKGVLEQHFSQKAKKDKSKAKQD